MVRQVAAGGRAPGASVDGDTPLNMPQAAKAAFRGPSPDWSPANQDTHAENLAVYSNCKSVELFLNGTSVGKSDQRGNNGTFTFNVTYAPGTLKVSGYDENGQPVANEEYRTAGPAAKIVLEPDAMKVPNDFDDLSFVRATITDANGVPVLNADNEITFNVTGAGRLAATDSADGNNPEPFQGNKRQAFGGKCVAFVKATAESGPITITATADGLADDSATLGAIPGKAP
jgi:beta-galactosidase